MAKKLGWRIETDKSIGKQVVYVLSGTGEDETILCVTPLINVNGFLACKYNGVVYDLMACGLRQHEWDPGEAAYVAPAMPCRHVTDTRFEDISPYEMTLFAEAVNLMNGAEMYRESFADRVTMQDGRQYVLSLYGSNPGGGVWKDKVEDENLLFSFNRAMFDKLRETVKFAARDVRPFNGYTE